MKKMVSIDLNIFTSTKYSLTPVDIIVLLLIDNGINPFIVPWGMNIEIGNIVESLERNMYIKTTEEGWILRTKGKEVIEPKENEDAIEVLTYLNKKTGKNFSINSESNLKFVRGRLNEGYTKEDLKRVIDVMYENWGNDSKMKMYLRPETLFNPTKFQTYVNLKSSNREEKDWTMKKI